MENVHPSEKVAEFYHKRITSANAFDPDDSLASGVTIDLVAEQTRTSQDWVTEIAAVRLRGHVAARVRDSFECSRGALCYGTAYHPLLTIAAHELVRVADFASVCACDQQGLRKRTFAQRIAALVALGIIPPADAVAWDSIRRARNEVSHPTSGVVYGFAAAFRLLRTVRDLIDRIAWQDPHHAD